MPLYKITYEDKTRLVSANSQQSALRHVTSPMFAVALVTDPTMAALLVSKGTELETATETAATKTTADTEESPQIKAQREMLGLILKPPKEEGASDEEGEK